MMAGAQTVADLMTTPVVSVTRTTDVSEAIRLLRHHHVRHLPVVNHHRVVVGVVSNRNMLVAHLTRGDLEGHRRVGHLMSSPPITTRPSESLSDAATQLLEHQIGCLPVTDDEGRLVGILAASDFVRAFTMPPG